MRKHLVIPDVQAKPGVPLDHLDHVGKYIVDKQPDVIVCLGDFADMESLSSYDKGKKAFEGRRYKSDIDVSVEAMTRLMAPLKAYNAHKAALKEKQYRPRLVLTLGNHEDRIRRAAEDDAQWDGLISVDDLKYKEFGWEVFPFLEVVTIDGVSYSHYFTSGPLGRPVTTARALVKAKHCSAVMGHVQLVDVFMDTRADGKPITGLFAGTCLAPHHKVLTADLRYVPLGSVQVGDKLVSFDEEPSQNGRRSRRYLTGTVEKADRATAECFEVELSDGKVFTATGNHRWLTKLGTNYRWVETTALQPRAGKRAGTGIPKLMDEWQTLDSYDAGWLSGMYDGEGCLHERTTTGGQCVQLGLSQKEGPVLERVRSVLASIGQDTLTHTGDRSASTLRIKGGTTNIAKVIGQLRPTRLLPKFRPETLTAICCPNSRKREVIRVTPVGPSEIVRIQIDVGTMIVEGYGHHNCYQHDEVYLGPQQNHCRRQVVMLHEVDDGGFDLMLVSLAYLRRKYGAAAA